MQIARRGFIAGMASLIAAPAIVKAGALMPVRMFDPYYRHYILDYLIGTDQQVIRCDVSLSPLAIPRFANLISEREAFKLIPKDRVMSLCPQKGQQLNISAIIPHNFSQLMVTS